MKFFVPFLILGIAISGGTLLYSIKGGNFDKSATDVSVRNQFLERRIENTSTFILELKSPSQSDMKIFNNNILLDELGGGQGQSKHAIAPLFDGSNQIRVVSDSNNIEFTVVRDKLELCAAATSAEKCNFLGTPAYLLESVAGVDISDANCINGEFLDQFFTGVPGINIQSSFETFFKVKHAEPCTGTISFAASHSAEFFGIPLMAGRPFDLVFPPEKRVRVLFSSDVGLNEAVLLLESDEQHGYLYFKDSRRVKSILWETI